MVLLVDNYDSFTYNLVQYLGELGAEVFVRRNDEVTVREVEDEIRPDRVVVSPGPGTPDDAGVSLELIANLSGHVPILGVCLGHQSIGQIFGGRVVRAPEPVHGKPAEICHDGKTIFEGLEYRFNAGRYHSLVVERETLPDCLEVSAAPEVSETCLNEIGICFMFAPLYHGTTARVAGVRRELGVHTTFNLLGPLTNPAGAPRQVIGFWHEALVEPLAHTLKALGAERAWVVHGLDGLDEGTLAARTKVAEVSGEGVRVFEVAPEDFGLEPAPLESLRGGDAV